MVEHQRKGRGLPGDSQPLPAEAGGCCSGSQDEGGLISWTATEGGLKKKKERGDRKERGGRGSGATKKGKFPDNVATNQVKKGPAAGRLDWASGGDGLLPTPTNVAPMRGAQNGRLVRPAGRDAGKQKGAAVAQHIPAQLPAPSAGTSLASSATVPLRSNLAARYAEHQRMNASTRETHHTRIDPGAPPASISSPGTLNHPGDNPGATRRFL